MRPEYDAELLDETLLGTLTGFVRSLASTEPSFGNANALLKYGRGYSSLRRKPEWLRVGEQGRCFKNATLYALARDDVFYAEGYAIDPYFPVPIQHAWLVDPAGKVIDPTWSGTTDHIYFGIAFRSSFVAEQLLHNKEEPGILVNINLMRHRLRSSEAIENEVIRGQAELSHSTVHAFKIALPGKVGLHEPRCLIGGIPALDGGTF